jgi:hypothetical protein
MGLKPLDIGPISHLFSMPILGHYSRYVGPPHKASLLIKATQVGLESLAQLDLRHPVEL